MNAGIVDANVGVVVADFVDAMALLSQQAHTAHRTKNGKQQQQEKKCKKSRNA